MHIRLEMSSKNSGDAVCEEEIRVLEGEMGEGDERMPESWVTWFTVLDKEGDDSIPY